MNTAFKISLLTFVLLATTASFEAKAQIGTTVQSIDACSYNQTGNCQGTKDNFKYYMDVHRRGGGGKDSFLFKTYWEKTVNPGLRKVLERIVSKTVRQGTSAGTLLEGQNNVRAITDLQKGVAQAARDKLPSEALCRFGTLSQSLAADDISTRTAQISFANSAIKRDLGTAGTASEAGNAAEINMRRDEVIKELGGSDASTKPMSSTNPQRRFPDLARDQNVNGDINFTRTLDAKATVVADFNGASELTPEQYALTMMGYNLYGHKQLSGRVKKKEMDSPKGQNKFLTTRSVTASRSVAQNSYAAITGMKAEGSGKGKEFFEALVTQLGIDKKNMKYIFGDRPSYYAQMDILTKKLYQQPSFYVNLMEGKTNVARQSSVMEGLELMQDRDIYNSMRRSEMLLAVLVQLQSRKKLDDVVEER